MRLRELLLFSVIVLSFSARAQFERPDVWFSIGYQYANFGNSLSPANNRMYEFNRENGEGRDFSNPANAYGAIVRMMIKGERGITTELAITNKKVMNHGSYMDNTTNTEVDVYTKSRVRAFTVGLHYAYTRFTVGASVDLGIFNSLIRYKNSPTEGSSKWNPWFSSPKIFGSGYTGKSPVIGTTLSAGCALTRFLDLRVYKQFTAFGMGADLSDRYFSLSNWGVELALTFGK